MPKTTRKLFLRSSTATDLQSVLKLLLAINNDIQGAISCLGKAVVILNNSIALANSKPTEHTQPLPIMLRKKLTALKDRTQSLETQIKDWAVTKEEKVLKKDRLNKEKSLKTERSSNGHL